MGGGSGIGGGVDFIRLLVISTFGAALLYAMAPRIRPAITPTVTVTVFSVEGVLFTVRFAAGGVTVSVAAGC